MKSKLLLTVLAVIVLLTAACQPISPNLEGAAPVVAQPEAQPEVVVPAVPEDALAVATVSTRSARVRAEPTVDSPMIGGVREGEQYEVVGRSSDGMWIQLRIPELGDGWVSADLVSVEGNITDLPIYDAPVAEATAVPTEAPVAEATPVPTEEPTAEPTAVPTEEPTEEPTAEPVTDATPEPVEEPVAELVPPAAGFAVVTSELRLRVRAEPSTDAAIVGYAYYGEVFQVLEVTEDGLWTRLAGAPESRENATGGWVASEFLLLGQ